MNVHVIGHKGTVGGATLRGLARFGHSVFGTDKGDDHVAVRAVVHFVCVPEAIVPEVVRGLAQCPIEEAIVIRSTVPPGTTQALATELGRPLLHNPEWLRQDMADMDFVGADRVLLGLSDGAVELADIVERVYAPMRVGVYKASCGETELAKLLTNAYLASLISCWNQAQLVARQAGVESHSVARLVMLDKRVSAYGAIAHGKAYGGFCLPKDVDQLRYYLKKQGVDTTFFDGVHEMNHLMGGAA